MTQAEWGKATDTHQMLRTLRHQLPGTRPDYGLDRRLRLFGVACCRRVGHLITKEWQRFALDVTDDDAYIPSQESGWRRELREWDESTRSWDESVSALDLAISSAVFPHEYWEATAHLLSRVNSILGERKQLQARRANPLAEVPDAHLLRDIFGYPFHPAVFAPEWRSEPAVALAHIMYDSRLFDRMPILADALEEAGCDVPEVLTHCRDPDAVHVRGCWVVDGVLGKS